MRVMGFVVLSLVVLVTGCFEDKCKNPKIITGMDQRGVNYREWPAYKCNAVITCPGRQGRPDKVIRLDGLTDPVIVEQGYNSLNRGFCVAKVKQNNECDGMKIEVSPEMVCLDAAGGPDSSGPGAAGPSGGTLVTVGAGAGSGDYYLQENGEGGAGGVDADPGEEGQGGI